MDSEILSWAIEGTAISFHVDGKGPPVPAPASGYVGAFRKQRVTSSELLTACSMIFPLLDH